MSTAASAPNSSEIVDPTRANPPPVMAVPSALSVSALSSAGASTSIRSAAPAK